MEGVLDGVCWFSGYIANAYLVRLGDGFYLIDLPAPSMVDELISHFGKIDVKVLFTHYHFDHIAGYTYMLRVMDPEYLFPEWFKGILTGRRPPVFPPFVKWVFGLLKIWRKQNLRFMGLRDFILSFSSGAPFFKIPNPFSLDEYENRKAYDELMAMGPTAIFPGHGHPVFLREP